MSYRVVYLLISVLFGVQLVFAADSALPREDGQTEHIERALILSPASPHIEVITDGGTRSNPPLIEALCHATIVQKHILSYLDLETLLALSGISKDLYTVTEIVFETACDARGFIQWPGKSHKLRFIGNLYYKRVFGLYPHEDRRVYYTRPTEPPYVHNMRLAHKLVDAGFPKGAEILEIKAHVKRMLALERSTKGSTQYNSAFMTRLSSYSFLSSKFHD
jgi:hypothetical protein